MVEKVYDLEDRLIEFSVLTMEIAEALPRSDSGRYLSGQMIRSGTRLHSFMERLKVQNREKILYIRLKSY